MSSGGEFGRTGIAGVRPAHMLVLADDLTGACDAAVAFAGGSATVHVALDREAGVGRDGVWAVNTESRDVPAEAAAARVRAAALRLAETPAAEIPEIFKKIDSVMRGNTFVEIAATLEAFAFDLAVIAPAYPALGRRVIGGGLMVGGQAEQAVDIGQRLAEVGCHPRQVGAAIGVAAVTEIMQGALREAETGSGATVLCDAAAQADLRVVVRAARALGGRVLWIGSGGLAHALAADLPATPARETAALRCGVTLFFIGSDHPVTLAQVAHLHRRAGLPLHSADVASEIAGDRMLSVVRGETTEEEIRRAVARLELRSTACLFLTGGDTALHVCRALGITSLTLQREFAPGVPLGLAEGGRFHGVPVILKSGGFGDEDLLHHILTTFADAAPEAMTA